MPKRNALILLDKTIMLASHCVPSANLEIDAINFATYSQRAKLKRFTQLRTMMTPLTQALLLLLLALVVLAGASPARAAVELEEGVVGGGRRQREFDYFALALQWPGTYCQRTRQCCSSNACCRGSNAPTTFTIHGLWPDYNDGTWPACCSKSHFDPKEISTLTDALQQYWPSLSCSSPSTCSGGKGSFWAHEWEKHGTCAYPVIRNEYDFFLTTLNVYFKYNVTRVLNEAGYVPSNKEKYPLGGIISAIENAFHASPLIVCSKDSIEELRLCFYKDFKPRDCAVGPDIKIDAVTSKGSCPKYVSLPEHVSLGRDGLQSWESNDAAL